MNIKEMLHNIMQVADELESQKREEERKAAFNVPDSDDTVRWIVSAGNEIGNGEFGVLVNGVPYWYYKYSDTEPCRSVKYRLVNKREFGEVIRAEKGENK